MSAPPRPAPVRRLGERGAVAAEFAVSLPAILLVLLLVLGALSAGARLVRLQDAAADAARLVARGEPIDRAFAPLAAVGGAGVVENRGDLVCVVATAPAPLALPPLSASSCALAGGL
jgi:hypothetical protein